MIEGRAAHWSPSPDGVSLVRDMTVADLLEQAVEKRGDAEALVCGEGAASTVRLTYSQLHESAVGVAAALIGSGLQPGDRAVVWAPNVVQHPLLQLGCALANVTIVPINPLYRRDELAYVLGRVRASAIFLTPEVRGLSLWSILEQVPGDVQPALRVALGASPGDGGASWDEWLQAGSAIGVDEVRQRRLGVRPGDLSQIQFTSGTTGFPKGVQLTNWIVANQGRAMAHVAQIEATDRYVNPLPLFHCGGCIVSGMGVLAAGGTHVPLSFDPGRICDTIEREGGTFLSGVPTMLLAVEEESAKNGQRLDSLRTIVTGGAVVPSALGQRWQRDLGVSFAITYGQTEFGPLATVTSPSDPPELQITTVGRPIPDVELDVVKPGSRDRVDVGEEGEIRYRGFVMAGYLGDPEATAAAVDDEGWLYSGDLGRMDAEGYVRITGRAKDMVIRGGENISPAAVEDAIRELEEVADTSVIGVPDDVYGEELCAFVRLREGAEGLSVADMRERLLTRVARFKIPRYLVIVEAFPTTPSGKVQRFKLRDLYDDAAAAGSLQDSRQPVARG